MKTTIKALFIGLLFSPIPTMYAQDEVVRNHPKYYQDGDCWMQALVPFNFEERIQMYEEEGFLPDFSLFAFYVEGDTIIDQKEYKCLHAKRWNYVGLPTDEHLSEGLIEVPELRNALFIREDADGKQWRRLAYLNDEALLFDFSHPFEVGQMIRFCKHTHLHALSYLHSSDESHVKVPAPDPRPDDVEFWRSEEEAPWGYLYYDLKVSDVTSVELSNGEQVPLANGHIAFGWGDILIGDLWHQFLPDEESLEGRFLFRVHQGQVIFQDQKNMKVISDLIDKDVSSLLNKNEDDYHPFIEEGKVWTVEHRDADTGEKIDEREFYFDGDTIMYDKHCSFLVCRKRVDGQGDEVSRVAPMYEEDKVVYFFWHYPDEPEFAPTSYILYDFSAEEGSSVTLELPDFTYALGDNSDHVIISNSIGSKCKFKTTYYHSIQERSVPCYCYQDDWNDGSERYNFYMEGIGSDLAPVFNVLTGAPNQEYLLKECRVNGQVLYTIDDNPRDQIDAFADEKESNAEREYIPFIERGKRWVVTRDVPQMDLFPYIRETYFIEGDTIIAGQECLKLMCRTENFQDQTEQTELVFPVFEKERCAYYVSKNETTPVAWRDFSLKRGGKVSVGCSDRWRSETNQKETESYQAWEEMTIQKDGYSFHAIRLAAGDWYQLSQSDRTLGPNSLWIEGIGSFISPMTDSYINPMGAIGETRQLQECTAGNRVLYRNPDYIPTNIHNIPEDPIITHHSSNHQYYDLSGRRVSVSSDSSVSSVLPKGVYIRDGKKVVVK